MSEQSQPPINPENIPDAHEEPKDLQQQEQVAPTVVPEQQESPLKETPDKLKEKLSNDLESLRAQRKQLDEAVAKRYCVRLNSLWRDWDGEEKRLVGALEAMNQGDNGQAIGYLEEQACQKLVELKQLEEKEKKRSAAFKGEQFKQKRERLQSEHTDLLPLTYEQVQTAYQKLEDKQIVQQLHEGFEANGKLNDLQAMSPDAKIDIVAQERSRMKHLRSVWPADFIAQRAEDPSLSPEDQYVYLRYAEIKAQKEWEEKTERNLQYRKSYKEEVENLDQMIQSAGGSPRSDADRESRVNEILIDPATDLSPEERYARILSNVNGSVEAAGEQINTTYSVLRQEKKKIESQLELIKDNPQKTEEVASLQRQERRMFFLLLRLDYVFAEHCKAQGIPESMPYLDEFVKSFTRRKEGEVSSSETKTPEKLNLTYTWPREGADEQPEERLDEVKTMGPYEVVGASDRGMKRKNREDEDSFGSFDIKTASGRHESLHILADGVGGHAKGKEASSLIVAKLEEKYKEIREKEPAKSISEALQEAVLYANQALVDKNENENIDSGSTCVVAVLEDDGTHTVVNVGDSRAYRVGNDKATQITEDHNLAAEILRTQAKDASSEEERLKIMQDLYTHPMRNQITKSMGKKDTSLTTANDVFFGKLQPGEQLLLCCDGLWEMTKDADGQVIHDFARSDPSQKEVARRLIAKANQEGGPDNITVLVAKYVGEKAPDTTSSA